MLSAFFFQTCLLFHLQILCEAMPADIQSGPWLPVFAHLEGGGLVGILFFDLESRHRYGGRCCCCTATRTPKSRAHHLHKIALRCRSLLIVIEEQRYNYDGMYNFPSAIFSVVRDGRNHPQWQGKAFKHYMAGESPS